MGWFSVKSNQTSKCRPHYLLAIDSKCKDLGREIAGSTEIYFGLNVDPMGLGPHW